MDSDLGAGDQFERFPLITASDRAALVRPVADLAAG